MTSRVDYKLCDMNTDDDQNLCEDEAIIEGSEAQSDQKVYSCQVCEDTATGFHYGVWSCEGCKAFFKRSIRGEVKYLCPATNTCKIDKIRRKCCPSCRLKKCLEVGMCERKHRKVGQKKRSCKKKRRSHQDTSPSDISTPSPSTSLQASPASCSKTPSLEKEPPLQKQPEVTSLHTITTQTNQHEKLKSCILLKEEIEAASNMSTNDTIYVTPSTEARLPEKVHNLVQLLVSIEPEIIMSGFNEAQLDEKNKENELFDALIKLADKEVLSLISWVKKLPGFTDLTLDDQVTLMELSWLEVMTIGLVQRSSPLTKNRIIFAPDLMFDEQRSISLGVDANINLIRELCRHYSDMQISKEECVLVKAIIVFNADVKPPNRKDVLHKHLNEYLQSLQIVAKHQHPEQPFRTSKLLLILPHIRQVSLKGISVMFEHLSKSADMSLELLKEMLCARPDINDFDKTPSAAS